MNNNLSGVNKTLYIPLYGKAYVSQRGLFLCDKNAEMIWEKEGFKLTGKAKSKWLAYYMGIRSAVFDDWVKEKISNPTDAVVLHIGCGMDSRVNRVEKNCTMWYDIDFPEVITERRRYFSEKEGYKMISADVRDPAWIGEIPSAKKAIVVMEGVSMYLTHDELKSLIEGICQKFGYVSLLMDCYSNLAAKMSKHRNPINDVGVTTVYGTDDPQFAETKSFVYLREHNMTPDSYIDLLHGGERMIFKKLYAGGFSKKLYRLYEYEKRA